MLLIRHFFLSITLILAWPSFANDDIGLPLTKESAANLIQQKSGGQVLSVDTESENGKTLYRIKVLHESGKIKIYNLDAQTGKKPSKG